MITRLLALVPLLLAPVSSLPQQTGRAARVEDDLEALRRALAEIRVALVADRAYAEAEGKLGALRERLVTRTDADAKALLAELDFLAADVARALGRGSPDVVDRAALEAIERSDWAFVSQLGPRAIPALAEAVRRDPETMAGDVKEDPLYHLTRLAILETDRLAAQLLERGGFFWKQRLLRALSQTSFVNRPEIWSESGPPWTLRTHGIVAALERALVDPEVQAVALDLASNLESHGLRLENFERALATGLHASGRLRDVAQQAARKVSSGRSAFFESLLEDPDGELRRFAVELLSELENGPTTWFQAATDPDPRVRGQVATALEDSDSWPSFPPDAFLGLLRDEDPWVRQPVWARLEQQRTSSENLELPVSERITNGSAWVRRVHVELPVRPEDLTSLTAAPERGLLAGVAPGLPAGACFRILEDLAADADESVLKAVGKGLDDSPYHEDPEAYVAVLARLWANDRCPVAVRSPRLLLRVETRAGVNALFRWLVSVGDGPAIATTLQDSSGARRLGALEPDLVVAVLRLAHEADPAGVEGLLRQRIPEEVLDSLVELAGREECSLELRLLAMQAATMQGRSPSEELAARRAVVAPGLLRALREQGWVARWSDTVERILHGLPDDRVNAFVRDWIQDPGFPVREGQSLLKCFRREGPGAREVVEAAIEAARRDPDAGRYVIAMVLGAMGDVAALRDPDFLEEMARGTDAFLAREALLAIGETSDPRFLPLLVSLVEGPVDAGTLERATQALFHYLDEEAVEPLLLAAKRVDPKLRDECIAHLEKIREYQDARERWATHRVRQQTREQVVVQLLGQLDSQDEAVRLEAIRALATWEAVEAMPRLIELSASGSKAVATAAKTALDRLNAPRGE